MLHTKQLLATMAVVTMGFTAQAITIDFGTQWDSSNLPLEVLGHSSGNGFSTETQIANLLNSVAGTTFGSSDIFKTDKPIANVGGQFAVGVALVAEVVPSRARPYALGFVQAASAVGNMIAAMTGIFVGQMEAAGTKIGRASCRERVFRVV